MNRVVVVGASLAGVRAAEALRREGYEGELVVIGDEDLAPYDRPPLSKQFLAGTWDADRVRLKVDPSVEPSLRLATRATGLDLAAREVELHTGERLGFDGLVIATGARPRELPGSRWPRSSGGMDGLFTLRTYEDSLAIRAAAERGARVVVVGAGFIGSEVASTCRGLGLEVTVLEAAPVPLERALGAEMGAVLGKLHTEHGVDLRLGTVVTEVEGTERVEAVRLADGSRLEADLVVVGIGVVPNTEWLEGSGVRVMDGVICDDFCAAVGAEGVVAAGDVARWHNPLFGESMRVEHWTNAAEQADAAANTLLHGRVRPYAPVPYFWSDQYGARIRMVGHPGPDNVVEVEEGSVDESKFVATYRRGSRVVAALTVNMPQRVMHYREVIEGGTDG